MGVGKAKKDVHKVYLAQLAEFITEIAFEDFPSGVVEYSKSLLLDNLGTSILGASHPKSKLATDIAKRFSSGAEAGIFAKNLKCSANMAAFANSCFCQIYDFNDGHRTAGQFGGTPHPGRTVVPTTLSEAELNAASGKQLLSALIIGYEVAIKMRKDKDKIGISIGPWLASTAIAARLRGYSRQQTQAALSIVSSVYINQARLKKIPPSLRHGFVARAGVEAAMLADCGMQSPKVPDELYISKCFSALGSNTGFETANVYLKPYPSCRMTHSPLEALFEIRRKNDFHYEDVEKITVRQIQQGMYVAKRRPRAALKFGSAHLSLYYCLAVALVYGELTLQALTEETLRDKRIQALYKRIEVVADDELSREYPDKGRPAVVHVELKNGVRLTSKIDIPKGNPSLPLTKDEVFQKFQANSAASFTQDTIYAIGETVFNLEKRDDLSELFKKLS